jgi:protein-L-isoaspartate(D-aspartate) O-methyltransferase
MSYIDFMSPLHKSTKRDYLARVNDLEYPKYKAAELAKKWSYDYWDGDRRINYGGYHYIEGRWEKVAKLMAKHYGLKAGDKVLDVGCGKGFLLYDLTNVVSGIEVYGLDISDYAINNSKEEVKNSLKVGNATNLPYKDNEFDFVYSINTLHNLYTYEL